MQTLMCILKGAQQLPILWSHTPDIANVPDTLDIPEHAIGSYMGQFVIAHSNLKPRAGSDCGLSYVVISTDLHSMKPRMNLEYLRL